MPPSDTLTIAEARLLASPEGSSGGEVLEVFSETSTLAHTLSDAVLVQLHTSVLIPDFKMYYQGPIQSFIPPYHALADGSLVATPFITDVRSANLFLVVLSASAMFFIFNVCTAVQFLRRARMRKMFLFYFLLASQLLGVLAMLSLISTFFDQFTNCNAISIVQKICLASSYTLLMTGILGYKAYRCLNSCRIVMIVLAIIRTGILVLFLLDLTKNNAHRRLSGSCMPTNHTGIMPYILVVQTIESAFICGCFLYAARKTTHSATYQGRISIRTISDLRKTTRPYGNLDTALIETHQSMARGWWDYVPAASRSKEGGSEPLKRDHPSRGQSPSVATVQPTLRTPITPPASNRPEMSRPFERTRPLSAVSSVRSRLGKYLSRMHVLKELLRNEVCYTASLTVVYLSMAILMLLGSSQRWLMTSIGWLSFDWIVISAFTMHSFKRVVRRHDREAILHHPTAWNSLYRADHVARRAMNAIHRVESSRSPVSIRSRHQIVSDPFQDGNYEARSSTSSTPFVHNYIPGVSPPSSLRSSSHDYEETDSERIAYTREHPGGEADLAIRNEELRVFPPKLETCA